MGEELIPLMTDEQLEAAMVAYYRTVAVRKFMMVAYLHVRRVLASHWRKCMKMPAGGAHAGGAQQTGFEMSLVSSNGVKELFNHWPNYQSVRLGHSWECRTMEECASVCDFAASPAGWGALNGKPILLSETLPDRTLHYPADGRRSAREKAVLAVGIN